MLHEITARFLATCEASGALPQDAGLAVAVVGPGGTIYQGTFGLRDRQRRLPVTSRTIFDVASLTKSLTAAALLEACHERRVDVESPVVGGEDVLALGDPYATSQLSIVDVLSHRTGLPSHDLLWYAGAVGAPDLRRRLRYLALVPGGFRETFIYNNVAYAALGDAFEALTGSDWETQIRERILEPADLRATSFTLPSGADGEVAQPYLGTKMMRRKPVSGIAAAAGLHSNIEDMARWLGVLIRGCTSLSSDTGVLSPATIQRMCAPHIAIAQPNALLMRGLEWLGNDATYGLGMFLGRSLGRQFAFHMAIIDGFTSVMAFSPVDQLGVVVLSNTNCSPVPGLLAQQLLTDSPVSASPGTASGGDARPALQPSRSVDIQVGGSYTSDAYGVIELQDAGEEKALLYGTERWPLELRGPGSASLTVPVLGMAIELPVEFEMAGGVPRALTIPLALDPRVAPECFRRC